MFNLLAQTTGITPEKISEVIKLLSSKAEQAEQGPAMFDSIVYWSERGVAVLFLLCLYKLGPIVWKGILKMHKEGTGAVSKLTEAVNILNTNMVVNDTAVNLQLQSIQRSVDETKYCALGIAQDMDCRKPQPRAKKKDEKVVTEG